MLFFGILASRDYTLCLPGGALLLWLLRCLYQSVRPSIPLPPGPRGLPLIGNLLHLPRTNRHLYYAPLSARYGPVISLKVLNKVIIVVNTPKAVQDVLEERAAATAGRPENIMVHVIAGLDKMPRLTNNMELHRQYRRLSA
ncbi:hypothetical protein CALCODRAFT_516716 [Calocera cornea HHB12733]|uniref:Cytochrome P450 n=1 Tax=Calocera cornea HHB12733 TaxID=1353952 RepID=A0A165GUS2_9BASI|nr:hypothetical protein CALCODRAFT_516716 [Calocera cornea HHB12733]